MKMKTLTLLLHLPERQQTSNCHSMIDEWLDEINYSGLTAPEK